MLEYVMSNIYFAHIFLRGNANIKSIEGCLKCKEHNKDMGRIIYGIFNIKHRVGGDLDSS